MRGDVMRIGHMWKAILAGAGALTTALGTLSLSAAQTGHEISVTAVIVAVLGALSTGAATYLKSNDPIPATDGPAPYWPAPDTAAPTPGSWPTEAEMAEPPAALKRRTFWQR